MERMMQEYLPDILREVRDFRCLMGVYQEALSDLRRRERETEDNFYLHTAGEAGLAHWERILGLSPRVGSGMDERRQIIIAAMRQTTPYCRRTLLMFLYALTGDREAFSAELHEFTLTVRLFPRWRGMEAAVWTLLRHMVPANIGIDFIPVFRTHRTLQGWTHGGLSKHTHQQLRNEVDLT